MKRRDFVKLVFAGATLLTLVFDMKPSLAENRSEKPDLSITWLGGPSMIVEFNGFKILTDPVFGEGDKAFLMGDPNEMFDLKKGPNIKHHKRITDFPKTEITQIDLLILSHVHEDHFDQKAQKMIGKNIPAVVSVADAEKVKTMGFNKVNPMPWDTKTVFKAGSGTITITAVPAEHSANVSISNILGKGNGYWFEFKQGDWQKTIYWTGDTFPTQTVMSALKALGEPDIFIPHLGKVGTSGPLGQISMSADDVTSMAEQLNPKKILPIHHSSLALYLEPIWKLTKTLNGRKFGLDLISEGSTIRYN